MGSGIVLVEGTVSSIIRSYNAYPMVSLRNSVSSARGPLKWCSGVVIDFVALKVIATDAPAQQMASFTSTRAWTVVQNSGNRDPYSTATEAAEENVASLPRRFKVGNLVTLGRSLPRTWFLWRQTLFEKYRSLGESTKDLTRVSDRVAEVTMPNYLRRAISFSGALYQINTYCASHLTEYST